MATLTTILQGVFFLELFRGEPVKNKTIKDGGIAPWKDLNKDKRKEQRNNNILIWGGLSSVSIFYVGLRAFGAQAMRM